jgi:YHS domain-containing protein
VIGLAAAADTISQSPGLSMKMSLKTNLAAATLALALWSFAGCDRSPSGPAPVGNAGGQPATRPATQPVVVAVNKFCPVMPEDAIDPEVTYVHNGKTYAFCCSNCIDDFKKDPEKFAKAAK